MKTRRVLVALAFLALGYGAILVWALESGGVAVVETHRADGSVRRTHVWYVDREGSLWLEAGRPENGWFVDVTRQPEVVFSTGGRSRIFRAQPFTGPEAHARIRDWIRQKYGARDWWVGLVVDTSRSVAVRLEPARDGRD